MKKITIYSSLIFTFFLLSLPAKSFYAEDKFRIENNKVYYSVNVLASADVDTFKVLNDRFAKDKDRIYCRSSVMVGADAPSFVVLGDVFAKDKNNTFYCNRNYNVGQKIDSADLPTFEVISSYFSKDKNRVYQEICWFENCRLVNTSIDPSSVQVLSPDVAMDKNFVFFASKQLKNVDLATFKVLDNSYYAKDKNRAYYLKKFPDTDAIEMVVLDKVDVETFVIYSKDPDKEYAKDKYFSYFKGEIYQPQSLAITNLNLYHKLSGKIIIRPEYNGEAYYITHSNKQMFFLSRPETAYFVMRTQGIGITSTDLEKIPVAEKCPSYQVNCDNSNKYDLNFAKKQKGKILLAVEENGEAWYINPTNGKRYFLGRPADAFAIMRNLGLGISENDFNNL